MEFPKSLYIHLPFCRSKCRYCDFYSDVVSDKQIYRYIEALAGELDQRRAGKASTIVDTIYLGGGTPSLLTANQWTFLGKQLCSRFSIQKGYEWTAECNPESFTKEKSTVMADMGINRLSFGIQSLHDRELRFLGRPHTASMAEVVLKEASMMNFNTIGVDVMVGIPGQTVASFVATLNPLLKMKAVKHLSAYELSVAACTPFGRHRGILPLPDEATIAEMVAILSTITREHGFEQYEISNFARSGYRCRHNLHYWNHDEYAGIGAAAHSFSEGRRFWNVNNYERYCSMIENGLSPIDASENIDAATGAREILFLALRQTCGLNEKHFERKTGYVFNEWIDREKLKRFVQDGFLIKDPPWWRPTEKGLLYADYLARELF